MVCSCYHNQNSTSDAMRNIIDKVTHFVLADFPRDNYIFELFTRKTLLTNCFDVLNVIFCTSTQLNLTKNVALFFFFF